MPPMWSPRAEAPAGIQYIRGRNSGEQVVETVKIAPSSCHIEAAWICSQDQWRIGADDPCPAVMQCPVVICLPPR
jgi:hypothetical protein